MAALPGCAGGSAIGLSATDEALVDDGGRIYAFSELGQRTLECRLRVTSVDFSAAAGCLLTS